VIELKVSRGYDRVVGQLLRYMAWVEQEMEPSKPVRGIIVAKEITDDLKLAASRISGVRLIEYEIEFKLRPI
jgi:endonuclease